MQLPETDTGSSGLYWGVEDYTVSSPIPPLIGTALSQNPRIPSLGAIPPHVPELLAMEAHHLPCPTGNPDSSHRRLGLRFPITFGFLPSWAILSKVSRLTEKVTYHLPCLTNYPILALILITFALSWISLRNRSLLLLSRVGRR